MIKVCGALGLLVIFMILTSAQDYLDGGYVGSGDYGEIGQYFTEPIFYSPGGGYVSSAPVIGPAQGYVNKPSNSLGLGSMSGRYTAGNAPASAKVSTSNVPSTSAAGRWHLQLSDGRSIDLNLYQSGLRIFGLGSLTSASKVQWATASGSISGNKMNPDVVTENATSLYSMSLDTSGLNLASSYTIFRAGAAPSSGTVKASRTA